MKNQLFSINLNNYVRPDPTYLLTQYSKYLTNGPDNNYFDLVERAYLGSPTNQSIIDNFSNYILGEGLRDESGITTVEDILSEEDQRLAVTDFKIQGACSFQVIYNLQGLVKEICYIPVKSLAINRQSDITEEPEGYWYSFDWKLKNRFKPVFYPAFGYGDKTQTEILYIRRPSPQPLFSLPDWQSGIQYAQTEEELSNYYINHISNNFSAGKIVNINQGLPPDEETAAEMRHSITTQLTGSSNAGRVIVCFADNKDNATEIKNVEITDAYSQFQFISKECTEKIMQAHKINDRGLFGIISASGFSSVADQMVQSLKILYRSQINPARKIITKGLDKAFKINNPRVKLYFEDFEELRVDAITPAENPVTLAVDTNKISFDYDGTLTIQSGSDLLDQMVTAGKDVYIISARNQADDLIKFALKHGILLTHVFATGSNEAKIAKVKELNISTHYDNNQNVVDQLGSIGKNINSI